MFLNIIKSYRDVVAICDKDILGKKFVEGKFQLDIKENFYKGEEADEESVIKIIKKMTAEDSTFNIVGKKSVDAALKTGIIAKEEIGEIQGVPFALVLF
ncbi:MAG TPA: DUF424 family protein [Bacillota bacterium]|nr:DUF424 family protein [Bacillota bacterium]